MLLLYSIYFLAGMALLLFGADKLTDTASHIAHRLGVNPIIIGMTILAVGTSIPEMSNAAISMAHGVGDVAFGDIIGSDLVQITLILGIVALIRPLQAKRKELVFYGIADLFAILLAFFAIKDGAIDWKDGIILILFYVVFLSYTIRNEHISKHHFTQRHDRHWVYYFLALIAGFILVFAGSRAVVFATKGFAQHFAWPTYVVAFLIVGLGTSLPELFIAANAARKKKFNLSVGTLLGSNITDPTLSLGFGALFTKGTLVPALAVHHLYFLIIATMLIIGAFALRKKFTKIMGLGAIGLYVLAIVIF